MPRAGYVYILANRRNGVTSNLVQRIWNHKHDVHEGFTSEYRVHRLVYFEEHGDIRDAIVREKQLKKWKRAWKVRLIEGVNPAWRELYDDLPET